MCDWMLWAVFVLSAFFAVALDGQGQAPPRAFEAAAGVPFDLGSDFLVVVKGGIRNLEGLKFIVDTGSTFSAIDRKVAERLQVNRSAGRIMNFDRYMPIEWADVTDFRMGPIRADSIRVMVMDLAKYSEFAKGVDGIIGLDLLSRSKRFTIDYGRRSLYFELAENETTKRAVPGGFLVTVVVQGLPIRLWVDTGSPDILLYGDRVRKRLTNLRTEGEPRTVTIGRIEGIKIALPEVRIGGPDEVISVVLLDGPDERTMPGLDGYLGTASLHAKRIEFDFAKMVLWWQ
jgi:predicted aspartyl protease